MELTGKMILDGGKTRLVWTDNQLHLEELPRTPRKIRLCRFDAHCGWQITTNRCDEFIPANVLRDAAIASSDTYAIALGKIAHALELAVTCAVRRLGRTLASFERVEGRVSEVHYLKVAPEGADKLTIALKDAALVVSWTSFSSYSPSSDFAQADPYYSEVVSSSPAAARKLYSIVKADPSALAAVSWLDLRSWLSARKIGHDSNHSVWR
jgi:hypothetical protein